MGHLSEAMLARDTSRAPTPLIPLQKAQESIAGYDETEDK